MVSRFLTETQAESLWTRSVERAGQKGCTYIRGHASESTRLIICLGLGHVRKRESGDHRLPALLALTVLAFVWGNAAHEAAALSRMGGEKTPGKVGTGTPGKIQWPCFFQSAATRSKQLL